MRIRGTKMAFQKSESYFMNKIAQIQKAIEGTEKAIPGLENEYQVQCHLGQIASYRKSLVKAEAEFKSFKEGK